MTPLSDLTQTLDPVLEVQSAFPEATLFSQIEGATIVSIIIALLRYGGPVLIALLEQWRPR